MIYERRYVQFNDLVIDSYDMIEETEMDVSFKYISHERSFGHGSYAPFKRDYVFANEASVSLTLRLNMRKLPCEKRPFYRQMAVSELSRPGKLWAVLNNELVWSYAVMTNFGETNSYRKDTLIINVDFTLPEGVWHKADLQKTFLQDYDVCIFMDCYDFKELNPCAEQSGTCCAECAMDEEGIIYTGEDRLIIGGKTFDAGCDCCICETLCEAMALCYNKERLQNVYNECADGLDFHIVYDCEKAQQFFGKEYLGQKFCTSDSCTGIIAGNLYANTDIPTTDFTIILHGYMQDPTITINDNTNIIEGDYSEEKGVMTIRSNGEVWYRQDDCCDDTLVAAGAWTIPKGNEYGWALKPGNNRFIVNTNMCCGISCAYVQVDGKTI